MDAWRALGRWRIVLIGLVLLEVVRTVAAFGMGQPVPGYDSLEYWQMAEQFVAGDWLLSESPTAHRTPGYPAFLAIWQFVGGSRGLLLAVACQHLLVIATSLLTGWTTYRITSSVRAGLAAYVLSVLCVTRPWYANVLLTETLFTFLLTAQTSAAVLAIERLSFSRVILLGAMAGAALLVRPVGQALWPALFFIVLVFGRTEDERHGWRLRGVRLLAAVVVVVALVSPWYLRNYVVYGEPFLTRFLGRELWISAFAEGAGAGLAWPQSSDADRLRALIRRTPGPIPLKNNWSVSRALTRAGLSDVEADHLMREVALDAIAEQPARFLKSVLRRGVNYWRVVEGDFPAYGDVEPDAAQRFGQTVWFSPRLRSWYRPVLERAPVHWLWWNALVAIAAWAGVVGLIGSRRMRPVGLIFGVTLCYFAVTTALLEIPNYRYRLVVEPLMIAAMVSGGWEVMRSLQSRRRQ